MKEDVSILILGKGRIAQAVFYYFKKYSGIKKIDFFSGEKNIKDFSLLISCLPAKDAYLGLELALKFRKNLLDISDLDPPFYLKRKKEIEKQNIFVIPGCGFSPGLLNFITARELILNPYIDGVIIKAGSLSKEKFFFPFLWCFEDLIQEHTLYSYQIISGKKIKCPPFSGYQNEEFLGIPSETYFCPSGFENILERKKFFDFHFRVIRPQGFMVFFNFLKNYGFFNKENIHQTKNLLEKIKKDNYTIATIELKRKNKRVAFWKIFSFSKRNSPLNSMQKITAVLPLSLFKVIFFKGIHLKGLKFMEDLAENKIIFEELLKGLREKEIFIKREGF
jgi:saccharopine dehydrogenase-like NADP-dependent oxidoreductase